MWVQSLWERSPGKGNGYPLHYSCLGNPMDRGEQGNLVGYSPWGCKDSNTAERLNYSNEVHSCGSREHRLFPHQAQELMPVHLQALDQNSRALRNAGRVHTPQVIWMCSHMRTTTPGPCQCLCDLLLLLRWLSLTVIIKLQRIVQVALPISPMIGIYWK